MCGLYCQHHKHAAYLADVSQCKDFEREPGTDELEKEGATLVRTRQPTVAEAVEIIMRSLTREYRIKALAYWERKYGEEYANEIKWRVEQMYLEHHE